MLRYIRDLAIGGFTVGLFGAAGVWCAQHIPYWLYLAGMVLH